MSVPGCNIGINTDSASCSAASSILSLSSATRPVMEEGALSEVLLTMYAEAAKARAKVYTSGSPPLIHHVQARAQLRQSRWGSTTPREIPSGASVAGSPAR
eukprot:CAMPEP_0119334738 /NCGR_PEP_ID=MMETSP1333-20130426/87965_1 /TAXON_ID=418940 /ORGANISM="Scyphosphaera apsteinii, Strain RCC1455" /LENGTH=100 /DNA_ID=CAMNT_0007345107 /DNA_START=285 /DNA_END=588 /DNA_ORIENTATION=-